jgi:hypothetical protein
MPESTAAPVPISFNPMCLNTGSGLGFPNDVVSCVFYTLGLLVLVLDLLVLVLGAL